MTRNVPLQCERRDRSIARLRLSIRHRPPRPAFRRIPQPRPRSMPQARLFRLNPVLEISNRLERRTRNDPSSQTLGEVAVNLDIEPIAW
jgi:hypothetical protein